MGKLRWQLLNISVYFHSRRGSMEISTGKGVKTPSYDILMLANSCRQPQFRVSEPQNKSWSTVCDR